ncbi:hypothetical protein LY78DRAFT_323385 [Colletotrichum sublineola]|nr:hypothetical protein LY78DRAFT_323385 [Colletotrichum sublineola]
MDAAERRRIQNREAQRRFRRKKTQQQGPWNSNTQEKLGNSSSRNFSFDYNATIADDSGNLQDPTAAMLLPLQSDLNVGGHDLRPSTSHVDCATQWLNAFPLEKDATTGDLRWHEIGHLTQLPQPSDAQSFHIPVGLNKAQ